MPAEDVRAVAAALHELELAVLRARMIPSARHDASVYPAIWDDADVFDTYLVPAFENLRVFYAAAARSSEAVIQTVC